MRVLAYAEVTCDDCGKSLRTLAPYRVQGRWAEKRLLKVLDQMASRHGWRMEGASAWAGDLCAGCRLNENRLIGGAS